MDYPVSTQRKKWLFKNEEELNKRREEARDAFLSTMPGWEALQDQLIPIESERVLLQYYAAKLLELCASLKVLPKVTCTACTFLRRFYVNRSSLEFDPQLLVLTCFYLASKVEDCYISADEVHRRSGMPADVILRFELSLLQGLDFDLQIHPPHKAFEGILIELEEMCKEEGYHDDISLLPTMKTRGRKYLNNMLQTDIILLYTPGQIAVKALQMACREIHDDMHKFQQYLALLLKRHQHESEAQKIQDILVEMEKYEFGTLNENEAAAIDRSLKLVAKSLKSLSKRKGQSDSER